MDLYSTAYLNGVVRRITPTPSFFLSLFPGLIEHDTDEVYFDVVSDKPRLTPFVHPMREGKLIEDAGYSTNAVKPAYVKDKRVFDPNKPYMQRAAGEQIGTNLSGEQRLQLALTAALADQSNMLQRRFEVMATEAVIFGRQTIIGDGFDQVVQYPRAAESFVTLSGGAKWDAVTSPDLARQFEDFDSMLKANCGGNTTHAVMDEKAWRLLASNTKFLEALDRRRGSDSISVDLAPTLSMDGLTFKGTYGQVAMYTYSHVYVDPVSNATVEAMPDNTIVFISKPRLQGVRHFGRIRDLKAGMMAMQKFTKSWEVEEPSVRFLLMQSAPIMAPYQPNAALTVTVA